MTLKYEVVKAYHRQQKMSVCGICYGDAIADPRKEVGHYFDGQWVSMHLPYPVAYFRAMEERNRERFDFSHGYCMPHKLSVLENQVRELNKQIQKLRHKK